MSTEGLFEVWFYTFFSWFYTIFVMILYMYIGPRQGQTTTGDKILMSTETLSLRSFATSLKKTKLYEVWFYYIFFHDFIHVYSPGAGADNPLGTKFLCQHENFVTLVICCKFKKESLWSLIFSSREPIAHWWAYRICWPLSSVCLSVCRLSVAHTL